MNHEYWDASVLPAESLHVQYLQRRLTAIPQLLTRYSIHNMIRRRIFALELTRLFGTLENHPHVELDRMHFDLRKQV